MIAEEYTPWVKIPKFNIGGKKNLRDDEPPCVYQKPFIQYLNTASVRTQLNIDPSLNQTKWQICYPVNYTQNINGSIGIYPELKGKYKMLKYTGDADGSVPTLGTLHWIRDLNWTVTEEWRAFHIVDDAGITQVAGYTESREGNFTLATIHGAGHMAPQWKRQQTYQAVFNWIAGVPL